MLEDVDKNLNVLIVDDQGLTRDMVRSIMRQLGFCNLNTAENGIRALEIISTHWIDLIICDWNMPLMKGIDLLRQVRSNEKYNKVKFIMLTAEAYKESVKEAASLRVDGYIAKPFTAQQLTASLAKILG
jgi:two-component system chemotaxis response regulator CheY